MLGYLTLYAFSTENWQRPQAEVDALMHLIVMAIERETPDLIKNNVRLTMIGDFEAYAGRGNGPSAAVHGRYGPLHRADAVSGAELFVALGDHRGVPPLWPRLRPRAL